MPGKSASAVSAFIDLATYDEIEKIPLWIR